MRIIGQKKFFLVSFEFENHIIRQYERSLQFAMTHDGRFRSFAEFDNEEQAFKIYKQIHDQYEKQYKNPPYNIIYIVPEFGG